SSQATSHSITLEGSLFAPCTTALARASVKASSMSSSCPSAHFISRTTFITLRTTGSMASRSPESVTLSLRSSFPASKLQDCGGCSEDGEESSIKGCGLGSSYPLTKMQEGAQRV